MSAPSQLAPQSTTYPGSRRGWIGVAGLGELEAVRTIKRNHRRVQRDPNCRSLLKGVRSLRDNPREVSVHFDILGEAAPFLVDAAAEGRCDLIANLHGNAEVWPSLHNGPRKVASEDGSWAGATPSIYCCEG